MKAAIRNKLLSTSLLAALMALATNIQADDTEIFFSSDSAPVNVLFVLDTSGSMGDPISGKQKLQIMKDSLKRVLSEDYPGLNVGIMQFNSEAGGVDFPVSSIDGESYIIDSDIPSGRTVETTMGHIVDSYVAGGLTSIVPALYEGYSYLAGEEVFSGKREPKTWSETDLKYIGNDVFSANPASYDPPDSWKAQTGVAGDYCYENTYTKTFFLQQETPIQCKPSNTFSGSCETRNIGTTNGCAAGWAWFPSDVGGGGWACVDGAAQTTNTQQLEFCRLKANGAWDVDPTYVSPMVHQCQETHLVLLSDGQPTAKNDSVNNRIASLVHGAGSTAADCDPLASITDAGIRTYGLCGVDLVAGMADAASASPPDMPLGKGVKTFTVGFDLSTNQAAKDYLQLIATAGDGEYYDAENETDLVNVFRAILTEVSKGNTSFTPPTFSISQANRITYDRDVYLGMFEPALTPRWPGNVKGYQLTHSGILDVFGNPAVDTDGHFIDGTRSYWSLVDDGKEITLGGLASKLPATRNVYTYTGAALPTSPVSLTATDQRLHETNTLLDNTMMGLPGTTTATERETTIRWARGVDVLDEDGDSNTTEIRKELGDPLHSRPVVHLYGSRKVLFSMNNSGFLHAFDVTSSNPSDANAGKELFAFIPQELLPHLKPLQDNLETTAKIYGLDGELTAWRPDDSHAYLFFGMRRGGNNYYALDVSDPEAPKLMWVIRGGNTGFEQLGQTWSRPSVVRVKHAGTEKSVVLFGGGYDVNQDNVSVRTADSVGKAVYVVDALTGSLLLTLGSGEDVNMPLNYSIPSDVRAVDLDGNRLVDRLYFGDMGGQLWRVDLDQGNIASTTTYYRMADIGGSDATSARRFYYPPAVALTYINYTAHLAVAMGSGYRAHPLNTDIDDRFYVFFDPDTTVGSTTISSKVPIIEGTLHDATDNPIGEDSSVTVSSALSGKNGWYIRLENNGEKALSAPLIFDKKLFFTTYLPEPAVTGGTVDVCSPTQSGGLAYIVNLTDATPAYDFTANGTFEKEDRVVILLENTIPSSPQVVFPKDGLIDTDGDGTPDSPDPNPSPQPASGCDDYTDFWAGKKQTAGGCTPVDRIYWDEQQ